MKVSVKEIRGMVRAAIKEAVGDTDDDKKLLTFLSKADKVMAECRDSLLKLIEEGEGLMREDLDKKERNQMILGVVGVAKKLHGVMVHAVEHVKKATG